jgi:hypothetical protein
MMDEIISLAFYVEAGHKDVGRHPYALPFWNE